MEGTFLQRLVAYIRKTKAEGQFSSYAIEELGVGIAAVSDNYGNGCEIDVYFEGELWEPIMPEIWEDGLYPPGLEGTGLGVLPGVGRAPRVNTFHDAFEFAQSQLKPKNQDARWYSQTRKTELLTDEKLAELASR